METKKTKQVKYYSYKCPRCNFECDMKESGFDRYTTSMTCPYCQTSMIKQGKKVKNGSN